MSNKFVDQWFLEIAPDANERVRLNIAADGTASIVGESGDLVTMMCDWDVFMEAPTLDALGELCKRDLDLND